MCKTSRATEQRKKSLSNIAWEQAKADGERPHLLGCIFLALPLLEAGMSMGRREQGGAEGGSDMRQGAPGLLYPVMPLLKVRCKDVRLGIALGVHQCGSLNDALGICQVPLLQIPRVSGPEFCTTNMLKYLKQ